MPVGLVGGGAFQIRKTYDRYTAGNVICVGFLGVFFDEIGIILLCVSVFLPIVKALDYDPLWFGVLFMITHKYHILLRPMVMSCFT